MIKYFNAILITLTLISSGIAQSNNSSHNWSIEVDPATFLFNGYGVHLRYTPSGYQNLLLGIGAYAMNLPSALVDMNASNKDQNWDVRLNQGYGLFGEYYFKEVNSKWFIGSQVSLQQYQLKNSEISGKSYYTNFLTMGYAGYVFKIAQTPFYLKPWGGLGYSTKVGGNIFVGNKEYDVASLTYFATLHVGFQF